GNPARESRCPRRAGRAVAGERARLRAREPAHRRRHRRAGGCAVEQARVIVVALTALTRLAATRHGESHAGSLCFQPGAAEASRLLSQTHHLQEHPPWPPAASRARTARPSKPRDATSKPSARVTARTAAATCKASSTSRRRSISTAARAPPFSLA